MKKFIEFWRLWPFAPEYQVQYILVSLLSYGGILALAIISLATHSKQQSVKRPFDNLHFLFVHREHGNYRFNALPSAAGTVSYNLSLFIFGKFLEV